MAAISYYVALPIFQSETGNWITGEPVESQQPFAARKKAQTMAKQHGGAVVFGRNGDPSTGEFQEAIIARFGTLPVNLTEIIGRRTCAPPFDAG